MTPAQNQQDISPEKILQVGLGFWGSKALLSAVELGVFTQLARGPMNLATLEDTLDLHTRASRDFFDALVALGFLKREGGLYFNTPETDLFLDKAKPSYVGGILEMANNRSYPFWGSLTEALRTGEHQNESKGGENLFETLYDNPARLREFLCAMTGVSLPAAAQIARKFDWSRCRSFTDVGTAQGGVAVQIALQNPHVRGIGYDLPRVRPVFEEYAAAFQLQDRLTFQAGDFFKDELPPSDVIIMGHILHDWDLETKRMLIAKAYRALPEGGSFIVFESLIDDDRSQNSFGLLMSLNMLIETPGGFDYTGADCARWLKDAGFRETRVVHLAGPDSMVVGTK